LKVEIMGEIWFWMQSHGNHMNVGSRAFYSFALNGAIDAISQNRLIEARYSRYRKQSLVLAIYVTTKQTHTESLDIAHSKETSNAESALTVDVNRVRSRFRLGPLCRPIVPRRPSFLGWFGARLVGLLLRLCRDR